MEELTNIKSYQEFESTFDKELAKQAESFVRVGYLLKIARDTTILADSGYTSVAEFAENRYGLSKDVVSRYIRINDRFSENGYSEQLAEQYKGFGYSKLAIMLTLPDAVADALTPQMSKSEITAVQKEVKEEQQIPPLQVIMEEQNKEQQELGTDLQRFLHQYGYECRKNVQALVNATEGENFIEETLDIIAPSGVAMLSVRIPGRGRLMLSIKGKDEKLTLIDVRQNENSEWQWEELKNDIKAVYQEGTEEAWERIYGEPFKKEEEKQVEKEPEKQPKQEEQVKKESKQAAVQEQCNSEEQGEKVNVQKENTISENGSVVKLKLNCIAEEMKDELFKSWFNAVSDDKIENACKMMASMRFTDLINVTPKKLFLLVQTSEVSTEEIKENGELLTKVEDGKHAGLFSAQDFLKRFTKKFLDPYKEKQSESNSISESHKNVSEVQESVPEQSNNVSESTEVAPVQQEKEKTKEGIAILAECVYAVIKQYREKLMNLSEYTVDTVKDALAIETTHFETWLEFIVEGVRYEAQVHTQAISKTKEVVIYEADSISLSEEYVWFIDEVYKEIADVLNFDEEALQEEQIPGQLHVSDYPEIQPESREAQPLKQQSDYITMSFRCLPKDIVYFIAKNRVEEAIVTQITIEENWIPQIEVKTTDPNTLIVAEFDEKEDWGKILFKSKAAAEKALEEHLTLEEQENK